MQIMSLIVQKVKKIVNYLGTTEGSLRHKIIRSSFWVSLSSLCVNISSVIRTIVLARLLAPEMFGLMSICVIVIKALEVFTQTGFGAALIHRQKDFEEAKDVAFTLFIIRGVILAMITFFISPLVASYYDRQILEVLIKVIAISFLFNGCRNVNTVGLQKELDFKRLTYLKQITTLVDLSMVIVLAYYFKNVWALVIGHVFSSFVGAILSFIIVPGRPRISFNRKVAGELFSYGKYITALTVILFIGAELDKAVLGKILGMEELGWYFMAFSIANLPATHISTLISTVMFPAFSKLQNNPKGLKEAFYKTFRVVGSITIPAAVGIATLAPEIISVIYGDKWMPSVLALKVLCFYGGFRAIQSVNGYLFNAIGKPVIPLYLNTARLIIIIILIYPLTTRFGLLGASVTVAAPAVAQYIVGTRVLCGILRFKSTKVLKTFLVITSHCCIMSLLILFLKSYMLNANLISLLFLISSGIIAYVLLNIKFVFALIKKRNF